MTSPLEKALDRVRVLETEIEELHRFISLYRSLSNDDVDVAVIGSVGMRDDMNDAQQLDRNTPVENLVPPPAWATAETGKRKRNATPPAEIVQLVQRMILEAGRPMTRGDLLEALEARDVEITVEDKARYIGTIMWRNKSKFVSIEGRGYWLRGETLPVRRAPSPTPFSQEQQEAIRQRNLEARHWEEVERDA